MVDWPDEPGDVEECHKKDMMAAACSGQERTALMPVLADLVAAGC